MEQKSSTTFDLDSNVLTISWECLNISSLKELSQTFRFDVVEDLNNLSTRTKCSFHVGEHFLNARIKITNSWYTIPIYLAHKSRPIMELYSSHIYLSDFTDISISVAELLGIIEKTFFKEPAIFIRGVEKQHKITFPVDLQVMLYSTGSTFAHMYRCNNCNKVFQFGARVPLPLTDSTPTIDELMFKQQEKHPITIHNCNSGAKGIAHYIGTS